MGTPRKVQSPQFSAHFYCGQTAVCIRIPLGTEVSLSLGDIVLDGNPVPPPLNTAPQFSANVCYGQTARWTKMPLGMEVGLGPGDFVFSSPQNRGTAATQFLAHVYCGETAGWMKTPLGTEVPRPRPHCVRRKPSLPPPRKGHSSPLSFRPMSIVATVAHLSYC